MFFVIDFLYIKPVSTNSPLLVIVNCTDMPYPFVLVVQSIYIFDKTKRKVIIGKMRRFSFMFLTISRKKCIDMLPYLTSDSLLS